MANPLLTPFMQARKPSIMSGELEGSDDSAEVEPLGPDYSDEEILELWKEIKHESFDGHWLFQRQWQRNLWYILGRQWIEYISNFGGWRDKRMASWIPRPVTNKFKETVQAIRAMFTSIALSVNVRPNGSDPKNVSAASTADQLSPLLHERHLMGAVMSEFDFWLIATGNAFLHTFMDYDLKHGELVITAEQCMGCGVVTPSDKLIGAQPVCSECGATDFQQATDPTTGVPIEHREPKGRPITIALSPMEVTLPRSYTRFDDVPYLTRSRWRTKRYIQSHPILKELEPQITWQTSPQDHSLSLYSSMAMTNDLGMAPGYGRDGGGYAGPNQEGIPEYEVWMKPNDKYREGLVFRILGDGANPIVVHLEDQEGLPGPLPYSDADGNKVFTFAHATYEHIGGRILGSGPLDVIVSKQDDLNQLDSFIKLIITRVANPVWMMPKGCEIEKLTGLPGLVVRYKIDPLGGAGSKPERVPGVSLDPGLMTLREQYLRDIEELSGTFDIVKGAKPPGVDSFSGLQLMVERSQARFSSVFTSRGAAYKEWSKFALELEREFGPDELTKAVLTPARKWTFESFKRAQLQGSFSVVVEDGSTTPKTSLSMRASVEHAAGLGMLNMMDPDQQYEGLKLFGLTRMVPTLDIHVQAALQKQQAFEDWIADPQNVQAFVAQAKQEQAFYTQEVQAYDAARTAVSQQMPGAAADPTRPLPPVPQPPPAPPAMLAGTPLEWFPWYNASIHMQEFLKWANDDHIRELSKTVPITVEMLKLHMQEIQAALAPPPGMLPAPPPSAQGAGRAMANSNKNSAPVGNTRQPALKA